MIKYDNFNSHPKNKIDVWIRDIFQFSENDRCEVDQIVARDDPSSFQTQITIDRKKKWQEILYYWETRISCYKKGRSKTPVFRDGDDWKIFVGIRIAFFCLVVRLCRYLFHGRGLSLLWSSGVSGGCQWSRCSGGCRCALHAELETIHDLFENKKGKGYKFALDE